MKDLKKRHDTFRHVVMAKFVNLNNALLNLTKEFASLSVALNQEEQLIQSQEKVIKAQGHLFLHQQSRIDILDKKISELNRSYILIIILLTLSLIFGILSMIVS